MLAARLGIRELLVKDETQRFGLNAFKAAGALFAVDTLIAAGRIRPGDTLACASEGNHGRAVARAARLAGCAARVYVGAAVTQPKADAIRSEGAEVVVVAGSYDEAVRVMAADASRHGWTIVSDTSWPGYEEIPRLIMLGYTRLLDEADAEWGEPPDAIFVPGGVGGLVAATACWSAWRYGETHGPFVVAVEPLRANCLQSSARAGRPTVLTGPFETDMGGLRCGEVSPLAFAASLGRVDAYVGIEDAWAREATRLLARPTPPDPAIEPGLSGAAALGGLLATMRDPGLADLTAHVSLGPASRVLAFVTEGVTDPDLFAHVMA
jgi:diaminopropionate ammonia-lyase